MRVEVHVERLVLEGVAAREGRILAGELQAELGRRLAQEGLPEALRRSGAIPEIRAGELAGAIPTNPRLVGRDVARVMMRGLKG